MGDQSAVDYLFNDLIANPSNFISAYKQAKKMEKEQIKNAWIEATPRNIPKYEAITRERAEEYYNKTFKK